MALKLVTGEELVVEILEENGSTIKFKNPVSIFPQRMPNGEVALGFAPWMQSAEGPFVIEFSKVLCFGETVNEEIKNGYNKIFGAGIVVPSQQLITG
jgi:hypothetical protein